MIALLLSKALFKEGYIYIHFLILLIGFECFYPPKTPTKHILQVVFIGCIQYRLFTLEPLINKIHKKIKIHLVKN